MKKILKKAFSIILLSAVLISCAQKGKSDEVQPSKDTIKPKPVDEKIIIQPNLRPVEIKIEKISSEQFYAAKQYEKVSKPIEKITDFQTVQKQLSGIVDFKEMDGYLGIKKIHFRNGTSSESNDEFEEYTFVAYFPTEDILLCEGGHTTDISFDLQTGQGTYDAGNPALVTSPPGGKYRLNKVFEGQECFNHFIQEKKQNKFQQIFELNEIFEKKTHKWLCVIEKEFWTDDVTLYFGLVTQYNEQGNEYEYYKVNIIEK